MSSDHFSPWSERQGESGFAWSWLGRGAGTATSLPFGVVNAPGSATTRPSSPRPRPRWPRCSPAGFWVALGTGEASNEHITGERLARQGARGRSGSASASTSSGRLLAGEEVTHHGLVDVDRARLWTRPAVAPPLLRRCRVRSRPRPGWATWADGLITVEPGPRRRPAPGPRGVPRSAGRRQAGLPPGARLVGSDGRGGAGHRPRPVAHQRVRTAGVLGSRAGRRTSTRRPAIVRPEDVARSRPRVGRSGWHLDRLAELVDARVRRCLDPSRRQAAAAVPRRLRRARRARAAGGVSE